jgi:hypothetical protein
LLISAAALDWQARLQNRALDRRGLNVVEQFGQMVMKFFCCGPLPDEKFVWKCSRIEGRGFPQAGRYPKNLDR